jgi:23S rRNA (pseudouridine1915-N3)-methyltransferase
VIHIIAVGKLKEAHYRQAAAEYARRLTRYTQLIISEVADDKEPERAGQALENRVKQAEGERILRLIKPRDRVVALCIDGEQDDSLAFSRRVKRLHEAPADAVFVIGGSLGLGDEVLARADERISLSSLTFPHQLARVVLLEQLYRAFKILANERYHK